MRSARDRRWVYFLLPGLLVVAWVLFSLLARPEWDLMVPFLFNSPNSVAHAFVTLIAGHGTFFERWDIFRHIAYSLGKVCLGFGTAAAVGIPLGVAMGWWPTFGRLVDPLVELVRPVPPIAWIPLAILWFTATKPAMFPGIFYAGFIIFIGAFFPILLNTIAGVKGVRQVFVEAGRTLGATQRQLLWKVIVPGSLPSILTGLRVGMGVGWMCVVAAEIVNAQYGLGFITVLGMRLADLGMIVAGMILIGLTGICIDRVFRFAENAALPWRGK